MKLGFITLLFVFAFFSVPSFAIDFFKDNRPRKPAPNSSWYMYWGLGYAWPSYPSTLQTTVDTNKNLSGSTHSALTFDLFGFYWKLSQSQILLGVINNDVFDRYSDSSSSSTINQYSLGPSAMYFFGKQIGEGLFLRGDAGLAYATANRSSGDKASSTLGPGVLLGFGYGVSTGGAGSVLFNLNYNYRSIDGAGYGTLALSVGGLF